MEAPSGRTEPCRVPQGKARGSRVNHPRRAHGSTRLVQPKLADRRSGAFGAPADLLEQRCLARELGPRARELLAGLGGDTGLVLLRERLP